MSLGSCCVVGATGQTGSAMVRELLGGAEARATRVVAFGNSRLPTYSGPRAELLEARQAPMEALASARRSELVGFDSLFIHVGTQVSGPVCVADDPRPAQMVFILLCMYLSPSHRGRRPALCAPR